MSEADKYELAIAENSGEVDGRIFTDEIVMKTDKLLADMEAQLAFKPTNFLYTIGWRAIVWKEKETGQFKELTEGEYAEFLERGTTQFSRGGSQDGGDSEDSTGVEGTTA